MALPSYAYPPSGAVARGVSAVPFSTGIAVPDWSTPTIWPYAFGHFNAGIVLASGVPGLAAAVADAASGIWTVSYAGTLWHQPAAGTATSTSMPTGSVYTGCSFVGGSAFVLSSSGTVLTSGGIVLGSFPTHALTLAGSGTTLAALLPASGLGTMNTAGVTGLIAFPAGLTTPSCLAMGSGAPVAVGGWAAAASLVAANAAALSLIDATSMVAVGSGNASVWRSAASGLGDAWASTQNLTGLANLTALSWSPDGFHVMAASPVSGSVQILAYAAGVLSLTQTLSVSGACATVIGTDSLHALVAQSGQAQLATLTFTSTWATGTPITGLAGITTVVGFGSSGAVAAYSSGLVYLGLASGVWTIGSTVALGFTPTLLAVDAFFDVYAAASGRFSVVDPTGLVLGSGAFTGIPTGLAVQQGRVALAVPASNTLYVYGQTPPGSWTQQASGALSLGASIGLALSDTTLFCMGSGSTVTMGFSGTPFVTTPVVSGVVAQRSGGAWTTTGLGVSNTPSAVGYDAAGNLRVLTTQNNAWVIASGGTVVSSGMVAQVSGQAASVPLGMAALTIAATGMYVATSIPGVLINIA